MGVTSSSIIQAFNRHWTYLDDPTVPHLTNGARFGAALAALGDINDDGFDGKMTGIHMSVVVQRTVALTYVLC